MTDTPTIIDKLNDRCERKRASDDEVTRLAGMTTAEFDADTTAPDPLPTVFNRFCTAYCITGDRELFHKFSLQRCMRFLWTWDILADLWQDFYTWGRAEMIAAQDAADLRETQADALV